MNYCGQCGQDVTGLRFCTRCGAPVDDAPRAERPVASPDTGEQPDWREDDDTPPIWQPLDLDDEPLQDDEPTRVQPAVDAGPPPAPAPQQVQPMPAQPLPPPPVADPATAAPPMVQPPPPPGAYPGPYPGPAQEPERRRGGWLPYAIAAWVVLAVVAGIVAWRLGVGDAGDARAVDTPATDPSSVEAGPTGTASEEVPEEVAGSETPAQSESPEASTSETPTVPPGDLQGEATATVPATAPPNEDVDGDLVRYEARNMLDGVASTAWRMPGDGAGQELAFTFPAPVTLTQVGLTNGYAKIDGSGRRQVDWYQRNRRLVSVEWIFDDGTVVPESFGDSLEPQVLDVGPVTTTTVRLRIVETTPPAPGPDGRDFTPISEVVLRGTPSG